jgi:formylglycine-generating enzyme
MGLPLTELPGKSGFMSASNGFLAILLFILPVLLPAQSDLYPEMIFVEGGTFTMGDGWGDGDSDEQPRHPVTLGSFKMAKTEVTVRQYRQFCHETGRSMPEVPVWGWLDNHPMVNVSWHDCVAYCEWLAEKLHTPYRLPTEAEWEYAARGGMHSKGTKYSGGQSIDLVGWYEDNAHNQTQPVATKMPNELGLFDMSGNVWEWCSDWYDSDYYRDSPTTNPLGPSTGSRRVTRGGGWTREAGLCRVADRSFSSPHFRFTRDGFRVVHSL